MARGGCGRSDKFDKNEQPENDRRDTIVPSPKTSYFRPDISLAACTMHGACHLQPKVPRTFHAFPRLFRFDAARASLRTSSSGWWWGAPATCEPEPCGRRLGGSLDAAVVVRRSAPTQLLENTNQVTERTLWCMLHRAYDGARFCYIIQPGKENEDSSRLTPAGRLRQQQPRWLPSAQDAASQS